jgi:LPXTG-motif cell wall-anchored protein
MDQNAAIMPTPSKRPAARIAEVRAAKDKDEPMNTANRLRARIHGHSLWRTTCVALAILLMTSTAFAAQPLTGTFKGKVIGRFVTFTKPNNKSVTDWAGVLGLQLDRDTLGDGLGPLAPVFCIQVNVLVRGGDRYKSDGSVTALHGGCQIRYLLDRYPASTATTADEAAARQLAIWHFSDDIDLTTVQEPAIQARAIALADEATLAIALGGCPGSQANVASLTLDPPTASVVAGQVVNYTVRADPPGAAQSVGIAISGSATLQNGQQQATLPLIQGVATFGVINPIAGTSTITARLPYVLDAGTVFSPINAGKPTQRLVMGDRLSLSASATVQATWGQATATPTTATPTTATPSTATPTTATPTTATPTTATATTVTPTAAPPTHATPVEAPPVTPTRTPSSKPKSTSTPAPQNTPESTPPSGGSGSTGPTPTGGIGNDVPGGNGAGGPGASSATPSSNGAQAGAGGTNATGQPRPSQLPNTGGNGSATPVAITIATLLIAYGVWLRRRAVGGV